ncbi:MAG: hypothetical protein EPO42_04265 [Gallionellaceae bacterium]|nr:MAG: hypothetical protein EPO42_04265 [Gallionellaceae bacterium]
MTQAGLQDQQQLIAALLNPQHYPHPAKTVRLIETHISWILLAGRYAYKIKKALDLGFLDTTTLESRHRDCAEEIRLNRRLAPQLYLGVAAIGGSCAHPAWGSQPAIEYAVEMRRFAPKKTFERLIVRDKIEARHMDALATMLAQFHANLPAAQTVTDKTKLHHALAQNFVQLSGLLPEAADMEKLAALQQASELAYRACAQRLQQRSAQGCVRECHGDLHLGNIALIGDRPVPFDGIDFNPALRHIDVMDEAAFLFMDLLHHRRPDLAYRFLNAYLERTGDYAGVGLLNFYCAYRATVRAKVCAIRANQTGIANSVKRKAMNDCRTYLTLAAGCLAPRLPKLIITHGLPGSGKSTFAQAALERMRAIRLRSDVERKRLFGLPALDDSRRDIYGTEATQHTYSHLLETARALLAAGYSVIVDAAFLKHDERAMFHKLAESMRAPFAIVTLQAGEATLRARIMQRQALANDASEADLAVLSKLQASQERLSQQEMRYTVMLSSEMDYESAWKALENLWCSSPVRPT